MKITSLEERMQEAASASQARNLAEAIDTAARSPRFSRTKADRLANWQKLVTLSTRRVEDLTREPTPTPKPDGLPRLDAPTLAGLNDANDTPHNGQRSLQPGADQSA